MDLKKVEKVPALLLVTTKNEALPINSESDRATLSSCIFSALEAYFFSHHLVNIFFELRGPSAN